MKKTHALVMLSIFLCAFLCGTAHAENLTATAVESQLKALKEQVERLEGELKSIKESASAQASKPSDQMAISSTKKESRGLLYDKGVRVQLGGFLESATIYRTRNESADMASSFNNGIPLPNSPNYHQHEFRGSARQSRISLLATGNPDDYSELNGYVETDFLGAAQTANSVESNSFNLRLRHAYMTADWNDLGLHLLGGQNWSLITAGSSGIVPRKENIPLQIDAQYIPGFTWTRQWQLRLVKDFDKKLWAGVSIENPQASVYGGPNKPGNAVFNSAPNGGFDSANTVSTDNAPDIVEKVAFDPGWGHYEVYGLTRFLHDRFSGKNEDRIGGAGGAAALVPVVPDTLSLTGSFLYGTGIGRYGSAQLPDATLRPDGSMALLTGSQLLTGAVLHPASDWDFYVYYGNEQVNKLRFAKNGLGYGYGSELYDNSGCQTEGSSNCTGNTKQIWQITGGTWWKFYQGDFGRAQFGIQYSFTKRDTFLGVGGSPDTNDQMIFSSLRYFPF